MEGVLFLVTGGEWVAHRINQLSLNPYWVHVGERGSFIYIFTQKTTHLKIFKVTGGVWVAHRINQLSLNPYWVHVWERGSFIYIFTQKTNQGYWKR